MNGTTQHSGTATSVQHAVGPSDPQVCCDQIRRQNRSRKSVGRHTQDKTGNLAVVVSLIQIAKVPGIMLSHSFGNTKMWSECYLAGDPKTQTNVAMRARYSNFSDSGLRNLYHLVLVALWTPFSSIV
jgi:hypothetical protein